MRIDLGDQKKRNALGRDANQHRTRQGSHQIQEAQSPFDPQRTWDLGEILHPKGMCMYSNECQTRDIETCCYQVTPSTSYCSLETHMETLSALPLYVSAEHHGIGMPQNGDRQPADLIVVSLLPYFKHVTWRRIHSSWADLDKCVPQIDMHVL